MIFDIVNVLTCKEDIDMGNGAEWIQCGCGQWIHEDCIDVTIGD